MTNGGYNKQNAAIFHNWIFIIFFSCDGTQDRLRLYYSEGKLRRNMRSFLFSSIQSRNKTTLYFNHVCQKVFTIFAAESFE